MDLDKLFLGMTVIAITMALCAALAAVYFGVNSALLHQHASAAAQQMTILHAFPTGKCLP